MERLEDRRLLSATVATDLADYLPGATALISGSGFAIGETIQLQVLHIDGTPNTGGGHEPWFVTDGVRGDFDSDGVMDGDLDGVVDGNISTTWYVNPDDSFGSTFELTASGLTSGEVATAQFTDARRFTATITPTGVLVGDAISYSLIVANDSTASETMGSVTIAIPTGAGTPTGLTFQAYDSSGTSAPVTWTASPIAGQLRFFNNTGNAANNINAGGRLEIQFTATATTTGLKQWTTTAYSGTTFSGQQLNSQNPQPAVAVDSTVLPEFHDGNPTCEDLQGAGQTWMDLKVDPVVGGVYTDGVLTVTVVVNANGTINWTSNIGVDAVFVKGGSGGNLYRYDPPTESTGDTGLHTPINPNNGTFFGNSHLNFCYDVEQGRIIVEKQTNPDGSIETFEFDPSYAANFSLSRRPAERQRPAWHLGSYTVQELAEAGWDLTNIQIVSGDTDNGSTIGSDSDFDAGDTTATIDLDAGEMITVRFTNTQRGRIIVEKQTNPDGSSRRSSSTPATPPISPGRRPAEQQRPAGAGQLHGPGTGRGGLGPDQHPDRQRRHRQRQHHRRRQPTSTPATPPPPSTSMPVK